MFDARVKEDRLVPHGTAPSPQQGSAPLFQANSKWMFGALLAVLVSGCRGEEPQLGSQTNWLLYCETAADCGGLACICGTCTLDCSGSASCGSLKDGSCVSSDSAGAVALCGGQAAATDFCAVKCEDGLCPSGSSCVAGVCSPDTSPTASVTINPENRFQPLIGFGAGLASTEEALLSHPEMGALLDAMFENSGLEIVRFKNRFEGDNHSDLESAEEIISQATMRLGKAPTVFLYSDSPPASLKANGSRTCTNFDVGCTLARNAEGGFDYVGFADYWRASLAAYAEAGVSPHYVSIQSNTDWLPGSADAETCRLLPREGLSMVVLGSGETVEAEFAGYMEAFAAVRAAVESSSLVTFAAPEVGSSPMVDSYASELEPAEYGALTFHLYGEDALEGNRVHLERIGEIATEVGLPVIQSEMAETGLNTAVLMHHTLVTAGGGAYLQRDFIVESAEEALDNESHSLIATDGDSFRLLPPYHALTHFARYTAQGWVRVDAQFEGGELLASAWLAPDDSALTIVLINPTTSAATVAVHAPENWESAFSDASVTRTVFDGVERSIELGSFSSSHGVEMPGNSILTISAKAPQ